MKKAKFSQFDGGMVNDPRDPSQNVCRFCAHFDAFTNKHKLTPHRSFETGDSSASSNTIRNFLYLSGTLYGLGHSASHAAASHISIFKKTNFTNATWTETDWGYVAGSDLTDAAANGFVAYHGYIFGFNGTRYVWRFTIDTTT